MSSQLTLGYRPAYVGAESWRKQLETLRSAVNYLGLKEVAFELDVSGSTLCDALNERDRKRWAAEWTHIVKAMLVARRDAIADDISRALLEADAEVLPFEISEPESLTPEQLAEGMRRELEAMGERGAAAISRVLRGGRRRR